MPTSIHIPKVLLQAVDRRARALKLSRNRFIVRTLERELGESKEWSPGFFELLRNVGGKNKKTIEEMTAAIAAGRTRKRPPSL
jgi:hypothetical protein